MMAYSADWPAATVFCCCELSVVANEGVTTLSVAAGADDDRKKASPL